ncbi:NEDD8-activating enzyme E1 regulatory subunit AXL [Selaginella moellendorffii]|nr:NEDD8-activating enzyme E1 regulatory subunit AXL [Selaginella moellendorffii]|eukprot:XP_002975259.2 NEDD8-activating enzyme E1 regulatory subunit AXL [Selaginella moellendorffii]
MKREREEAAAAGKEERDGAAAIRHCPGLMAHANGGSGDEQKKAAAAAATRSNKYDRQLRIWGEHGQGALEQASVCLLNCGATGSEALKNLVLGGIGNVTAVDGGLVQESDLGNNFLLSAENLGQPRAKSMAALLQEMNDSVLIDHIDASPESLLDSDPGFFARFTLVIATQMRDRSLVILDEVCRRFSVMLLVARSYGLTGYVRISLREHAVIESKPDNTVSDLRLHRPWPELTTFVKEFNLETEDSLVHKHIPFAIILLKVCEEWRSKHGGALPSTTKERSEFKSLVASKKQAQDEDNYKEAVAAASKVWSPPSLSSEVKAILEDGAADVDSSSSDFWILVAALKGFVASEGGGEFPLDGAIPDMHSFTEYYILLQRCYQAKAESDVSAVEAHVRSILSQLGRDPDSISRAAIKHFCKNSRNLRVLRYSSLAEELGLKEVGAKLQKYLPFEGDNANYAIYLMFRAVDRFAEEFGRFPGAMADETVEEDAAKLGAIAHKLAGEIGVDGGVSEEFVYEFSRFGGGEIHCVGAVVGGIASQEAIKLVTKQFTPTAGTLIYNAISSTTTIFQL